MAFLICFLNFHIEGKGGLISESVSLESVSLESVSLHPKSPNKDASIYTIIWDLIQSEKVPDTIKPILP